MAERLQESIQLDVEILNLRILLRQGFLLIGDGRLLRRDLGLLISNGPLLLFNLSLQSGHHLTECLQFFLFTHHALPPSCRRWTSFDGHLVA